MHVIIYGVVNCLPGESAGGSADPQRDGGGRLAGRRACRWLGLTGTRSGAARAVWNRQLARASTVAMPGGQQPSAPRVISNSTVGAAAYAGVAAHGVQDEFWHWLLRAIWARGRYRSSACEVQRLITDLPWPAGAGTDLAVLLAPAGRMRRQLALVLAGYAALLAAAVPWWLRGGTARPTRPPACGVCWLSVASSCGGRAPCAFRGGRAGHCPVETAEVAS
jgi:hypothetical protein